MTIILILASTGLLLMMIGRWLILHEAAPLHPAWRLALIALPLADIAFAVTSWTRARAGALTCLLGAALLLPLAGEALWEAQEPHSRAPGGVTVRSQFAALWGADARSAAARASQAEAANLLEAKQLKVQHLETYLGPWYEALQKRRARLMDAGAGDVAAFNKEAAAYQSLLAAAHEELAELEALKAAQAGR